MELVELLFRAEKRLSGLHPLVADKARALIRKAYEEGIYIIITQGFRTVEEQNRLYALGRTKPGRIVTNARGGYSYHNFGLAFDVCVCNVFKGTLIPSWSLDRRWFRVGQIGKSLGLEWGGDWKSFKDYPHFQYTFGLSLAQLRAGKRPPAAVVAKK
ncbi:M15 family metallopeptidase [Geobacillus stearothermophilus]|uniref:Peptidase M15C domain-containing protein n=3 Tax=Geobacillus TaxID=129337 RepID=Q5QL26_GEOKA|nr:MULTISPECIES: M15 family metallopeptidase [Geobacillus]AKM20737.1 Peptidoglycan L-alanyl-D-glutamate endopeptidase CwlK precursor [Geobacillus sp. 12AMOR1]MED4923079.1 M15 family metallopeptidase [Anoxybacillus geothermalis]STO36872.1 Peptidoglycan L-alanyl-D-glutamate endopeptidase CwlK precursor [[Flavobacterium] thermophilum]AMV12670.1 peptidase M15 [Geobacillus thermoleovorans]AMV12699.1 peptidase M15 [Geobacillus thermoleovorans]